MPAKADEEEHLGETAGVKMLLCPDMWLASILGMVVDVKQYVKGGVDQEIVHGGLEPGVSGNGLGDDQVAWACEQESVQEGRDEQLLLPGVLQQAPQQEL